MRTKSVVGLAAIIAALWLISDVNRGRFHQDVYTVCIGLAGDGPVVSAEEKRTCSCMASAASGVLPWKSRLPQSMILLSDAENDRMLEAQRNCRTEGADVKG